MKKPLITAICGCMAAFAFAQSNKNTKTVTGTVIDSAKNAPVSYATISIQDATTAQPVKSILTKENGSFQLSGLPDKSLQMVIACVGYQHKKITIPRFDDKGKADMGKIMVSAAANELKEVSVTAPKPLVKQEIDRISYDVQSDPESKVLTAMDMLRKLPLITVDGDDNIQLSGSSNYRIFINGKPSALLVTNPKDVLKAMPANTIQKIEVITTPPAKYDSEGLAGIINIITVKKTEDGYNVTLTGRYNIPWGPNTNVTGTYKKGKFGISGYGGIGQQNKVTLPTYNARETFGNNPSMLSQDGTRSFGGHFLYSSVQLSYEIDTLNLLTSSLNYNRGGFLLNNYRHVDFTSSDFDQSYDFYNNGGFHWRGTDVGLDYQHGFKRSKDQLLTMSYKYSYSLNGNNATVNNINRVNYNDPDYNQLNDAGSKEHTFQLDYVEPVNKLNIEAGAKAILRTNYSDFESNLFSPTLNEYIPDPSRTNDFNYQQNIYSAYNSYQLKLTKWTFKGGLRYEHTNINADFKSTNTTLNSGYDNFVPSVSIMHMLKGNASFTFGYTNRIQRPGIDQLNPFVNKNDPRFISSGNPNLSPVVNHLFELNFTKTGKGTFNTRLAYTFTGNSIEYVTTLIGDTASFSSPQNLGKNKNLGLSVNSSYPITSKLNVNMNGQIGRLWINGFYNGQAYGTSAYRGNVYASFSYKLNDAFTFGLNTGYYSKSIQLQGTSSSYFFTSYRVNYTFLNQKASLNAFINNPYQHMWTYRNFTHGPNFSQYGYYVNYYRQAGFGFTYKIGKLSSDIKKNKRGISNDDKSNNGNNNNTNGGN
jgi:outer membrane receptor protein involved in Fe transport